MALLKSLIQRLLDSRTTPEEAGHSAMPSPTEVSLTPSVTSKEVWGDVCTGTASSDGYIRMSFSATSPEALGSARSFGAVVFSTPQLKGDIVSVVCPVAKGRAYAMSARNATGISCAFVKLIGSIGGGDKLLVRRALSCLRALSNFLQRSFCKASILTLLTNVGRVQQYRTKTFREEVNNISLPHLVVGPCFRLEGLMTSPISGSDLKTPQERLAISLTPLVGGNGPRSRYRRVTQSLWILASTRVRGILLLFATNRQNNFVSGGAAC